MTDTEEHILALAMNKLNEALKRLLEQDIHKRLDTDIYERIKEAKLMIELAIKLHRS